jgi:hypothetical protein
VPVEETEEGRVAPVAEAEAAEEAGVGDEAAPALADGGCAGEGGGLRRETDEDLAEEVVVVQWPGRRRADVVVVAAAGAAHRSCPRAGSSGECSDTEQRKMTIIVREPLTFSLF